MLTRKITDIRLGITRKLKDCRDSYGRLRRNERLPCPFKTSRDDGGCGGTYRFQQELQGLFS